ncbi:MAG: fibronectin type III domain-containing protein [Gracilimonas sp.]|nr:fibronectin type III domain-containing protein [Gracilimonas sp.]
MKQIITVSIGVIIGLVGLLVFANEEPSNGIKSKEVKRILLTWQQDPTTTMTIDWHTNNDLIESEIQYRESGKTEWIKETGKYHGFPFTDQIIHRVELVKLKPGTDYEFMVQPSEIIYSFRTMPENADEPIRFVAGGDPGGGSEFIRMSEQAATHKPDFIVLSGDLSLENPDPNNAFWLVEGFQNSFKGDNNRLIPVIAAIGNHDVWKERNIPDSVEIDFYRNEYDLQNGDSPLFDSLFAFPGVPRYGVLDFGNYLSWIILDSGHRSKVDGEQADWLDRTLKEREGKPHIFASYHVGAYPSIRSFEGPASIIRENWVSSFDKYGLDVAFEAHDHIYKRSYLLKEGKVVENEGVLYLGDGGWGAPTRQPDKTPRWYLARSVGDRHVIVGTIYGNQRNFIAINAEGKIIDEYPVKKTSRVEIEAGKRVVQRIFKKAEKPANKSDSLALVTIYKETGGRSWNENTNWLKGPVHSWEGVRVKDGRVTRLYLQNNNLTGILPSEFTELTALKRLYINRNPKLSGSLPADIFKLENLKRIRMQGNGLTGEIPDNISKITGLQQLLLSNNHFMGTIPPEISQLKYLSELDLSGNNLSGTIPSELGDMDYRLQWLDLSDNKLSGSIPDELGNLRFLKKLHLYGNNFDSGVPVTVLALQNKELKDLSY